jgi:hypothetical protein
MGNAGFDQLIVTCINAPTFRFRVTLTTVMAYSGRFFRFLSATCARIFVIIGFSCLLTFVFILYKPTPGPGMIQRLGWQSWEVINMGNDPTPQGHNASAVGSGNHLEEVDWWNVTTPEQTIDSASLPLDVWAPLLPHDTGRASARISYIRD